MARIVGLGGRQDRKAGGRAQLPNTPAACTRLLKSGALKLSCLLPPPARCAPISALRNDEGREGGGVTANAGQDGKAGPVDVASAVPVPAAEHTDDVITGGAVGKEANFIHIVVLLRWYQTVFGIQFVQNVEKAVHLVRVNLQGEAGRAGKKLSGLTGWRDRPSRGAVHSGRMGACQASKHPSTTLR